MHDGMQYDPIQGKVTSPWKLQFLPICSAVYNGSWQLTTDYQTWAHYLHLIGADFWYLS